MRLRQAITLAVTLGVLCMAFFAPVRVRVNGTFWSHVFDVGHFPLLGWLAAVLFSTLPDRVQPDSRRYLLAFVLASVFAGAVEIIQPHFGRTRDLGDFINGSLGAALALTGIAAWRRTNRWLWRGGHAVALFVTLAIALWPAYEEWRGLRWRQKHFPSLGDFENEDELRLWRGQGGSPGHPTNIAFTRAHASQGEQSLRIVGGAGNWAGVNYDAGDKDWTSFRALVLDVFNPREPFRVFVRVDDNGVVAKFADRYEHGFDLVPGWNRLRILTAELERGPQNRRLNLKAIRRVAVFTGDHEPERFWFLDYVHLETRDE